MNETNNYQSKPKLLYALKHRYMKLNIFEDYRNTAKSLQA